MKFKTVILISTALILSTLQADNPAPTEISNAIPVVGRTLIDVSVLEMYTTGYRASKLLKSSVYNKEGEKVGKIDDFIVLGNGSVAFAVIGVGGFLGIGEKLVAVPAILFETNKKGQLELPDATKEVLKSLPSFKYN